MKNLAFANILNEMADILEMQGVDWKPQAYRKAARSIETLSEDIKLIYKKGGTKALKAIPGVGESIANKIEEFLKTGKVKKYQKLRRSIPKGVESMMHLQGLGPKKAWTLFKKLKIDSLKKLERAAKQGKIRKLTGFGPKTEEEILTSLSLFRRGKERPLLGTVMPIARELETKLKRLKEVKRVEIAGSIRRRKETIRDIDILIISNKPAKVMEFFTKMNNVKRVLAKGPTKSSVTLREGLNADLRVLQAKNFGAAFNYFTGSKDHNIKLRQIAIKKGYKLSEYGLFKKKRLIAGKSEKELYRKLGMQYIPPELRENAGEIDAAKKKKIPKLIDYKDIKGDLHLHTAWTDGVNTTKEMISHAVKMGYKYIAFTDHSKSTRIANGLDEKRLAKRLQEFKKIKSKIPVWKGSEVDILKDGRLDYTNATLKKLEVVIASIHSGFKMSKKDMTKRILKAIENPHVTILGHPTGRIINQRNPYEADWDKVFQAAKDNNVALEINAYPSRLDLSDIRIKKAKEYKCKFMINTDAHSVDHFRFIEYGIATARRGWLEKKDVLNTLPYNKLAKLIRSKR